MKSGTFFSDSLFGSIVGVMAVAILLLLVNAIFFPTLAYGDEGAKSYFKTLMEQVAIADKGEVGTFGLWQKMEREENKEFFLIYFGGKYKFSFNNEGAEDGRTFLAKGGDNRICICYWDGKEGVCDYCKGLDYPVRYKSGENSVEWESGAWVIATGEQVTIKKVGEEYEFVRT